MKCSSIISISLFTLIFVSTISPAIANDYMQNGGNLLQIEQYDTNKILPTPSIEIKATNNSQNDIKAKNIKSDNGTNGFKFTLVSQIMDFGELTPTNPLIRNNILHILNTNSNKYSIFIYEDHPLSTNDSTFIPGTSCDNGACNELRSSIWANTLSYGFGYHCESNSGASCESDFEFADSYRRIPDITNEIFMTDILLGSKSNNEASATITYKLNIAASQPQGSYTNNITYLAIPGY